ncbi:MAG: DUF1353 domain-containing protein [Candidatus Latescibacteria bacterium]|nr:DUF1353 domain-containing protein [Candidatus Latescibacterota bacterium]
MASPGHFSGNPKTEWLSDPGKPDREMRLLEDLSFTDLDGRVWRAPKGSVINGASIPRPLWASTGSPYTDDYRNASVVHDVAYDDPNIPRKDADKMFFYACIAGGCSILQAAKLYAGVRLGDWLSKVKKRLPFSRSMLLYRLPGQQDAQEAELRAKYTLIATEIDDRLNEESSFEAVDALVESRLK